MIPAIEQLTWTLTGWEVLFVGLGFILGITRTLSVFTQPLRSSFQRKGEGGGDA